MIAFGRGFVLRVGPRSGPGSEDSNPVGRAVSFSRARAQAPLGARAMRLRAWTMTKMTLIVTSVAENGIVMAGDSMTTRPDPEGPVKLLHEPNSATKILHHPKGNFGVGVWEFANMGDAKTEVLADDWIRTWMNGLSELASAREARHDLNGHLGNYLDRRIEKEPQWLVPRGGFHVAGFHEDRAEAWHITNDVPCRDRDETIILREWPRKNEKCGFRSPNSLTIISNGEQASGKGYDEFQIWNGATHFVRRAIFEVEKRQSRGHRRATDEYKFDRLKGRFNYFVDVIQAVAQKADDVDGFVRGVSFGADGSSSRMHKPPKLPV